MLNIMRENAKSWVIKVVLILIVPVFVFWGVGSFKKSKSCSILLEINGDSVDMTEFLLIYNNALEEFKTKFKLDTVPQGKIDYIKKLALERLIDRKLIVQQALKMGLFIEDKELIASIKSDRSFLVGDVFDVSCYHNMLNSVGLTPGQFECFTRESLLVEKLVDILYKTSKVSDLEVLNWYNWYNSLVALDYIFFAADVDPDDICDIQKLREYFDQNRNNYKSECVQKLRIAIFDPADYLDKSDVDENTIVKYFNSNPILFTNNKTVDVSHILIKTAEFSRSDEEAKTIAADVGNEAKTGADFSKLARMYSECSSAQEGGKLGNIEYNMVLEPFAKAAFSMNVGDISCPIKTKFGWHIIKVNAVTPKEKKTLSESREKIVDLLSKTQANALAYSEAKKMLEKCFSANDLSKYAKLDDIELIDTDWFSYEGPRDFRENGPLFASLASDMKVGQIGDICEIGDCYCILQLLDRIPPKILEFEAVREKVCSDFKKYVCLEKAKLDARSFIEITERGVTFEAAAELYEVPIFSTGYFMRGDPKAAQNEVEDKLVRRSFELHQKGDILQDVIEDKKGCYVVSLIDIKKPSFAGENTAVDVKNEFRKILIAQKQANSLLKLLEKLRDASNIIIRDKFRHI